MHTQINQIPTTGGHRCHEQKGNQKIGPAYFGRLDTSINGLYTPFRAHETGRKLGCRLLA